jgi:hypothetical protein
MNLRHVVAAVALAFGPSVALAQNFGRDTDEFRIETEPPQPGARGLGVSGYVYNDTGVRVSDVRLRVEILDRGGTVVGESWGWVYGSVGARQRAWFWIPLKTRGQTYRVSVYSFGRYSANAP